MRIYAIGDVHGQLTMLHGAHALIDADRAAHRDNTAPVVHLGDFVDRGPDSRGVIDFLIDGRDAGAPWIMLKGNHDRIFAGFMANADYRDPALNTEIDWFDRRMGGAETLASYGVRHRGWSMVRRTWDAAQRAVPSSHIDFLNGLDLFYETDDLIFVHAGIRPRVPMSQQTEDDLVWIRGPFLDSDRDHGKLVVHGHTALHQPEHFGNRVDLDSGAGYGRPITAAVFEDRDCFILTDQGRAPLLVPSYWTG